MPKRVQIGLLTTAVLAALAVAGFRISAAKDHAPVSWTWHTTPASAATVLKALHTPTGFQPSNCAVAGESCFSRRRSIPIDNPTMARLLASMGLEPYSVYGGNSINCTGNREPHRVPKLSFLECNAGALVGNERVMIYARAVVVVGPDWVHGTTARLGGGSPGEVEVEVVGHRVRES